MIKQLEQMTYREVEQGLLERIYEYIWSPSQALLTEISVMVSRYREIQVDRISQLYSRVPCSFDCLYSALDNSNWDVNDAAILLLRTVCTS